MTRRVSLTVAGTVLMLGLAAMVPLAAQSTADQILKREEARLAALKSGQGREPFYSKDYVVINPPGRFVTGFTPPAQPNPAAFIKDPKVIVATPSAAVVTMLSGPRPATAQVSSATDPDRGLNVWANEQGTWRLVARQAVWVRQPPQTPPSPRGDVKDVPYTPANAAEAAVIKANDALNEAFRARNAAAYEANTAPEFVRISNFGGVTPRADFVRNAVLGGTGTRLPAASDETRVRIYGDVAVVTYRNLRNNERMMRVFVNRGGWKAVAAISTIIWDAGMK